MFSLMINKGESAKASFIKTFVIWVFDYTIKGVSISYKHSSIFYVFHLFYLYSFPYYSFFFVFI